MLGFGHAKRCMTIANAFREANCDVRFVCRDNPDSYFKAAANDHEVFWIEAASAEQGSHHARNLNDAESTVQICTTNGFKPDLVILDHYLLDVIWEKRIRAFSSKILVIEDFLGRHHSVDYVLGCSLKLSNESYFEEPARTAFLLGQKYFILDKDFSRERIRPLSSLRNRMLLFFGSADLTGETEKVLRALREHGDLINDRIGSIHVVLGACNKAVSRIERLLSAFPSPRLSVQLETLSTAIKETDIFFTAGGNAMVEGVALGKACIVISTAGNQADLCEEFAALPYVHYLGGHASVRSSDIAEAIRNAAKLFNRRILPVIRRSPIDTLGASRVVGRVLPDLIAGT